MLDVIKRWGSRGSLSVADEAVFSGSNFVMSILLGRWLPTPEYGTFAVIFSIFLFAAGFYNALILEPMSVIGPAKYRGSLLHYALSLKTLHWTLGLAITAILLLASGGFVLISGLSPLVNGLLGLALAFPLILLAWLARRTFYLVQKPARALRCSVIYAFLLIAGLVFLKSFEYLSLLTVFLLMGFSGGVAGSLSLGLERNNVNPAKTPARKTVQVFIAENWHYSKWVIVITIVQWITANFYYVFTASYLDFEQTAALRAAQNLVLPVGHVVTALMVFLLPWASKRMADLGLETVRKDVSKMTLIMVGISLTYIVAVISFGRFVMEILYSGNYSEFVWLLPYLAVVPLISAATSGWQTGLRVLQAPSAIFVVYSVGAGITLTVGVALVGFLGLQGAAIGMIVSSVAQLPLHFWYWKKISSAQRE